MKANGISQVLTIMRKSFLTNAAFIPVYFSCLLLVYSIASRSIGLFQKKNRQRRLKTFFLKPLVIFQFFILPLAIPHKTRLHSKKLGKILLHPSEIFNPNIKTPGNSTLSLINPWKIHLLFFQYPWKFHILPPPVWFFSGIAHFSVISLYS